MARQDVEFGQLRIGLGYKLVMSFELGLPSNVTPSLMFKD